MRNILEFILLCIIFLPATTIMLWIIVPDRVFNAAEVLQKDLIPVLEEAKKINEAAIAAITNLKRKGKL